MYLKNDTMILICINCHDAQKIVLCHIILFLANNQERFTKIIVLIVLILFMKASFNKHGVTDLQFKFKHSTAVLRKPKRLLHHVLNYKRLILKQWS